MIRFDETLESSLVAVAEGLDPEVLLRVCDVARGGRKTRVRQCADALLRAAEPLPVRLEIHFRSLLQG
jgi:hypothetical protein